jgi:hypothetical protein
MSCESDHLFLLAKSATGDLEEERAMPEDASQRLGSTR